MENSYQQQYNTQQQQQQQKQWPGSQISSSISSSSSSSSLSSEDDLSNITISAGYWNRNKYSAFDLVRQQSRDTEGQTSLGWSQQIVKKQIIMLNSIHDSVLSKYFNKHYSFAFSLTRSIYFMFFFYPKSSLPRFIGACCPIF